MGKLALVVGSFVAFVACLLPACFGSGNNGGVISPTCTGASCSCPSNTTCEFDPTDCGDAGSCSSLTCSINSVCTGSCDESCRANCLGNSRCQLTVGAGGSVSCAGTRCDVTCTGTCSMTCASNSTCNLTCPDAGLVGIEAGGPGSCP